MTCRSHAFLPPRGSEAPQGTDWSLEPDTSRGGDGDTAGDHPGLSPRVGGYQAALCAMIRGPNHSEAVPQPWYLSQGLWLGTPHPQSHGLAACARGLWWLGLPPGGGVICVFCPEPWRALWSPGESDSHLDTVTSWSEGRASQLNPTLADLPAGTRSLSQQKEALAGPDPGTLSPGR